jgi:hypothetical protein
MSTWHSARFAKSVHLTHHALQRMAHRGLDLGAVANLIETGTVKWKDARHCWIFQQTPGRGDNLVCAAVIIDQAIIVKTIMTHWEERDG